MNTQPILQIQGLTKDYGGVRAVNTVSFDLGAGEICAIIGPNGAGKSSLFNLICGTTPPSAGTIRFLGRDITGIKPYQAARLGIARAFQITSIFPSLTAQENIQCALIASNKGTYRFLSLGKTSFREQAKVLLSRVGLYNSKDEVAASLSYGDRRILDVAMAMAINPRLILIDEPTQGLAKAESVRLMEVIKSQVKEIGLTVLFTEHDMDVVFSSTENVIVMHEGRLLLKGTPDEVKQNRQLAEIYLGTIA